MFQCRCQAKVPWEGKQSCQAEALAASKERFPGPTSIRPGDFDLDRVSRVPFVARGRVRYLSFKQFGKPFKRVGLHRHADVSI
jgi:hypothetical protein